MEFTYFLVAHLTLSYIGPLLVIFVSYVLVFHRIWSRQIPSASVEMQTASQLLQQSKMRALRMRAAVVMAFFISFPSHLRHIHTVQTGRFEGQRMGVSKRR